MSPVPCVVKAAMSVAHGSHTVECKHDDLSVARWLMAWLTGEGHRERVAGPRVCGSRSVWITYVCGFLQVVKSRATLTKEKAAKTKAKVLRVWDCDAVCGVCVCV